MRNNPRVCEFEAQVHHLLRDFRNDGLFETQFLHL